MNATLQSRIRSLLKNTNTKGVCCKNTKLQDLFPFRATLLHLPCQCQWIPPHSQFSVIKPGVTATWINKEQATPHVDYVAQHDHQHPSTPSDSFRLFMSNSTTIKNKTITNRPLSSRHFKHVSEIYTWKC